MSRPPIHRPAPSPRSAAAGRYFAPDFAALVALAEAVARDRHGIEIPAKGRGLARTLIELPALLAHILGEHQSLYAREAFLASAALPDTVQGLAITPSLTGEGLLVSGTGSPVPVERITLPTTVASIAPAPATPAPSPSPSASAAARSTGASPKHSTLWALLAAAAISLVAALVVVVKR